MNRCSEIISEARASNTKSQTAEPSPQPERLRRNGLGKCDWLLCFYPKDQCLIRLKVSLADATDSVLVPHYLSEFQSCSTSAVTFIEPSAARAIESVSGSAVSRTSKMAPSVERQIRICRISDCRFSGSVANSERSGEVSMRLVQSVSVMES